MDLEYSELSVNAIYEFKKLQGISHVQAWKMNLVAVSHDASNLIIAEGKKINIYRLDKTTKQPPLRPWKQLIIDSDESLEESSINALRTGYLGGEEVLVTVDTIGNVYIFFMNEFDRIPIKLSNDNESTWGIALASDSRALAVSANNHEVTYFDLKAREDGKEKSVAFEQSRKIFKGHGHNIPSIDISPCGRILVSCSIDKKCRLWDIQNGECIRTATNIDMDWGWRVLFISRRTIKQIANDDPMIDKVVKLSKEWHDVIPPRLFRTSDAVSFGQTRTENNLDASGTRAELIAVIPRTTHFLEGPNHIHNYNDFIRRLQEETRNSQDRRRNNDLNSPALGATGFYHSEENENSSYASIEEDNISSAYWELLQDGYSDHEENENVDLEELEREEYWEELESAEDSGQESDNELYEGELENDVLNEQMPDIVNSHSTKRNNTHTSNIRPTEPEEPGLVEAISRQYGCNLSSNEQSEELVEMMKRQIRDFDQKMFEKQREQEKQIQLSDNDLILYTSAHSLYLLNGDLKVIYVWKYLIPRNIPISPALCQFDRLCFLQYVPDLSLAIVGTQAGIVILVRILRFMSPVTDKNELNIDKREGISSHKNFNQIYIFHPQVILPMNALSQPPKVPLIGLHCAKHDHAIKSLLYYRLYLVYYDQSISCYEIRHNDELGPLLDVRLAYL